MRYQYFESHPNATPPKNRWRQWILTLVLLGILIVAGVWIGRLIPQSSEPKPQEAFFEGYFTLNAILDKALQQRFPDLILESVEMQTGGQSVHRFQLPQNSTTNSVEIQQTITSTIGGYGFKLFSSDIAKDQWEFLVGKDSTVWAELIFNFTGEQEETDVVTALPAGMKKGTNQPRIAIVIDDFGYAYNRTIQAFMALPYPLDYSIIPDRPYSTRIAQQLHQNNRLIMIHMPMVTINNTSSEPKLALKSGLSDEEIETRLQDAYKSVPYAVGMNNHQGSGATQDADLMASVMRWLREKNLWFVDSRTIAETVGAETARKSGVKTVSRDIFLDDVDDISAIKKELIHLANLAQDRGSAVAIGHCRPNTLAALESYLPIFKKAGYEIVPVTQLLH